MADLDFKLVIDTVTDGITDATKQINGFFDNIEKRAKKIQSIGNSLSLAITAPLVGFGALAVKNFAETDKALTNVQNSLEKTGNVSKETFDGIIADADKLSKNSLFGKADILNNVSANLLLFKNISSDVFPTVSQLAVDLAAKFNIDLATASKTIGKALNQPADALNSLTRIGVQFTDQQQKQINQLLLANKGFEAQAIVIDRLKESVNGAALALSQTSLGPLQKLKKDFGDFTEQFGKAILDTFNPFLIKIDEIIIKNSSLGESFTQTAVKFGALAAAVGPSLSAFGLFLKNISSLINPVTIFLGILVGVTSALDFLSTKFSIVNSFISAANTLTFGAITIFTRFAQVLAFSAKGFASIGAAIEQFTGGTFFSNLRDSLDETTKQLGEFANNTGNVMLDEFQNVFKGEKRDVISVNDLLPDFNKLFADVNKAGEDLGKGLGEGFNKGASFNQPTTKPLEDQIKKLTELQRIMSDSFATFFENIAFGAKSAAQAFKDLGQTIVQSLFSTILRNTLNSAFSGFLPGLSLGAPKAEGGAIVGPGTSTSDSILTRLSNGEFVIKASSVKKFGVDFFSQLNKGFMPKFNMGGFVKNVKNNLSGIPRMATGGLVSQTAPVNVQVINNSSQPVTARVKRTVDPNGIITQIVLEDLKSNGPISQQFQGAFGVTR